MKNINNLKGALLFTKNAAKNTSNVIGVAGFFLIPVAITASSLPTPSPTDSALVSLAVDAAIIFAVICVSRFILSKFKQA